MAEIEEIVDTVENEEIADTIDSEIIESEIEIPSQLAPVAITIPELREKYKDTNTKTIFIEFQKAAKKLQDLNQAIREIHILESYDNLTDNQKFLHDEIDNKLEMFKAESINKNIILLVSNTDNELLTHSSEDLKYKYMFFISIDEATKWVDENTTDDDEGNIYIAPLFIAV